MSEPGTMCYYMLPLVKAGKVGYVGNAAGLIPYDYYLLASMVITSREIE